ncbi:hypothetical protein RirG_049440 [Rhizophagus irregularis DAOM 197198w]|uniref:Btb/poz domain-containing protein 19-like n=1 Tax=Rhizophagus irregularis (strain DAOM 197198w) TaxID=1432141 RepID=A0A015N607_RHIIW|nr:hypothetical protein RirG_049440 [Rhizophagus irregularis DAOM 197198w]
MATKFLEELSNDYKKLFETEIGHDVIIYAGEEPNIKEFHVHSNILCIRSQYFHSAFSNEWAEKKDGKFIFKKPNITPQLFNIILRFIYYGIIELEKLQIPDMLELLIAVDELNINSLISHIQEFLIEHQPEFLLQCKIEIIEAIHQYESFTDLCNFYLEKICEEPKTLFGSDKFINLKASLLEILLKRNDLIIDEIEIWEYVLKWCFAQQNIKNDPTKWSKRDITKIERGILRFIPLIRFYDIEPADFFYKVYCYKDILPQDIINNLLEFHIVPNVKPKTDLSPPRKTNLNYQPDSTFIESKHIPLFASWIDKKDASYYNRKNIPFDFKLLYRSSQDGISTSSFHKNCDNKGATIWIAKIKNSTQLIGGYNPLDWNGNGYKTTTDSFLFNFTNEKNISTAKVSYVDKQNCAIYCHIYYGPAMGNLLCRDNNWHYDNYDNGNRYPKIGIPTNFEIDDYEVFQVIKN